MKNSLIFFFSIDTTISLRKKLQEYKPKYLELIIFGFLRYFKNFLVQIPQNPHLIKQHYLCDCV